MPHDLEARCRSASWCFGAGCARPAETIAAEVVALVRDRIGPAASFEHALVVPRLPKTRSGKILRGAMRSLARDQPHQMPATIEDPGVLEEIRAVLHESGARPST